MDVKVDGYVSSLRFVPRVEETWSFWDVPFYVLSGPMISFGRPQKDHHVLLIRYPHEDHDPERPQDAYRVARAFCSRHGFFIADHLNSFPEFQAVISRRRILGGSTT